MQEPSEFELRKFVAPEFVFGIGARKLAGRYATNFGARKVMVVTDPGVIAAGWAGDIIAALKTAGVDHVVFSSVSGNPREKEVMDGAAIYLAQGCNTLLAIGGGSPMDCAKGIGIVTSNKRNILEFEGVDKVEVSSPPLICVPTTAGTSADLSQFAIITDSGKKLKIAIVSKMVVPDVALIDPQTTITMPPYLTACTGIDALTHAIEAFVSTAHAPITDLHALHAIRLIMTNLLPAINEPENVTPRGRMMLASLEAGLAFSNASLGAVHAMAHSLGGLLDQPHGECNAILLPHVIDANFDAAPDRYEEVGKAMGVKAGTVDRAGIKAAILSGLNGLVGEAGVSFGLGRMGVRKQDIPLLAERALNDPCIVTNPRLLRHRDIEAIYEKAL
ncbi:MAG TPA: alcohol dehydrogenase-like regulatory protein ErcA [Geobacteraceae bacterium]|nr:alcohol dehydrogenase-like regulatory protein ErcA [Geobacteraceae bacterium]